ncbi:DUF6517 family protein [Salinirubrum litoreum]|uniref:DUF6517 family protein n=1 Tax=Salinirubrum litoreum TaxID=1126234 RepID=A0ABD5R6K4_9EURY|nr:DUF6517 family protein [Salinirubrum litoreum]
MSNRRTLATLLLAGLIVTSGCTQLLGSGPAEFEAESAVVADSAVEANDYQLNDTREVELTRTLSVAGAEKEVVVTNEVATYEKSLDLGVLGSQKLGVVAVFASPQVEVAGQAMNPIGDWSNQKLVREIGSRYDAISNVEPTGESQNVTVLGTDTEVATFEGSTSVQGQQVDVTIHVTKFAHEGDYVAVVGAYPSQFGGQESGVMEMIRAVEHPAETEN